MNAIIVEDDIYDQKSLIWIFSQFRRIICIKGIFNDGLEFFKYLQNHQVDVIFLDIHVPTVDGLILAQTINQWDSKPLIVFITAYKEHAVHALELEAFDYILKPLKKSRIIKMLRDLEENNFHPFSKESQYFYNSYKSANFHTLNLVKNKRFIVTNISDICYVEAHKKMTFVYTFSGEEYVMPVSISKFCKQLPSAYFFRCHRSYCVNINHIREIEPWFNQTYLLKLHHQKLRVPVSRSKIKIFRQIMHI
ncbi:MAG: LytTR family DNA-binding domain-containing protein [Candidatus Dasytiphilus stammeri]